MNKRFRLEKSTHRPGWWVLTDTVNLIVIRFEEHNYNDSRTITFLEDSPMERMSPEDLKKAVRETADYMGRYHSSIALEGPYCFEYGEDDEHLYICRSEPPRWCCELIDNPGSRDMADTLTQAAEWLRKGGKPKNNY